MTVESIHRKHYHSFIDLFSVLLYNVFWVQCGENAVIKPHISMICFFPLWIARLVRNWLHKEKFIHIMKILFYKGFEKVFFLIVSL